MSAAAALVDHDAPAVVLTLWQSAAARLAVSGGFGVSFVPNEEEVDAKEAEAARVAAEEGASSAREHGWAARARIAQADTGVAMIIIEIADELDAGLIVCGRRGRGPVTSALFGSISRAVLAHSGRPVLVAPEPADTASVKHPPSAVS